MADTWYKPPATCGEKIIVPAAFQDPPRGPPASAMFRGGPPNISMRFSLPPAKKAMERLSGDQNGYNAPSVPGSSREISDSIGRSQSLLPLLELATKAMIWPLGEMALPPAASS